MAFVVADHPEMRIQELWATLTLRAAIAALRASTLVITTRRVGNYRKGAYHRPTAMPVLITMLEHRHKPLSTAVTSLCYQGQLKPNITHQEPLTASHRGVIYLV